MKKDKKKSISGKSWIIIGVIILAVLGIAIPIIINECYKKGGYVTEWSCGELLDYYGSLLGSVATIAALIFTIRFTRRQVVSERKIESETKKWETVEKLFDEALEAANPYLLTSIYYSHEKNKDYHNGMVELENQYAKAGLACDKFKCCVSVISNNDYKSDMQGLISTFDKAIKELEYFKKVYFDCLAEAENTKDEEELYNISCDAYDKLKLIDTFYNSIYLPLLKEKSRIFRKIYSDILNKGNKSL